MNPSNDHYQPSPNLPAPTFEVPAAAEHTQAPKNPGQQAETASVAAELPRASAPMPAQPSLPAQPPAAPPPLATAPAAPATALSAHSPATADDSDLIEQEWVSRAKAIVERTREDPHLQNKEMNKFKADYIKKRYNREIKVTEE